MSPKLVQIVLLARVNIGNIKRKSLSLFISKNDHKEQNTLTWQVSPIVLKSATFYNFKLRLKKFECFI